MFTIYCRSSIDDLIWNIQLDVGSFEEAENVCKSLNLNVVEIGELVEQHLWDTTSLNSMIN